MLHRLHWTPRKRAQLGLHSATCVECNTETGTYAHMFWKCIKIQRFWEDVQGEVTSLIGYDCQLSPLQCILAAKVNTARNKANTKLIGTLLYVARKTNLKFWISKDTPTLDDWYKEVLRIFPL